MKEQVELRITMTKEYAEMNLKGVATKELLIRALGQLELAKHIILKQLDNRPLQNDEHEFNEWREDHDA